MRISRFERGSAVYKCNSCGRATRNTGDEGSTRLCFECFELAGIDNEISDNGPLGPNSFSSPDYVVELLRKLLKHGVDVDVAWKGTNIAEFIPKAKEGL